MKWPGWQASGHFPFLWVWRFGTGAEQVCISVCSGWSVFKLELHFSCCQPGTVDTRLVSSSLWLQDIKQNHINFPVLQVFTMFQDKFCPKCSFGQDQTDTLFFFVHLAFFPMDPRKRPCLERAVSLKGPDGPSFETVLGVVKTVDVNQVRLLVLIIDFVVEVAAQHPICFMCLP